MNTHPKTADDVEALYLDPEEIGSWKIKMENVAIVQLTPRRYALGIIDDSRSNWLHYGSDGQPPARDFPRVRIFTKTMDYTSVHIALGILQSDYAYKMDRLLPRDAAQRESIVQS
jgi:hypothetical protein